MLIPMSEYIYSHCGLDPQSPTVEGIPRQARNDGTGKFFAREYKLDTDFTDLYGLALFYNEKFVLSALHPLISVQISV